MTRTTTHVTPRLVAASVAGLVLAPTAPADAQAAPLHACFVDRQGTSLTLVKESVTASRDGSPTQRAEAAANAVMSQAGMHGHLNVWGERVVTAVAVRADHVDLTVDGPTRAVDAATARAGVSSVTCPVDAELGRQLPVVFRGIDGRAIDPLPASRPAPPSPVVRTLPPITIETPGRRVHRGVVVATGHVVAPEGTVRFTLQRGHRVVRSGFTTATVGAPDRGQWRLRLGTLRRGTYRLVVWVPDESGATAHLGRAVRTITVR